MTREGEDYFEESRVIIRNEQEDDEQSTDAFNYALESLQMIAQTTDEQSTQLCLHGALQPPMSRGSEDITGGNGGNHYKDDWEISSRISS